MYDKCKNCTAQEAKFHCINLIKISCFYAVANIGASYNSWFVLQHSLYLQEREESKKYDFQKLKFHRNGGNVVVDLTEIPTGWTLRGKSVEVDLNILILTFLYT